MRRAHHRHEIAGRALIGIAGVPAGECRERRAELRWPDTGYFIAVGVDRGHVRAIRSTGAWRVCGDAMLPLRSEVEAAWPRDAIGKTHLRELAKESGERFGLDRGAVGDARKRARRRLDTGAHPAVEVHERGTQERRVVDDVEAMHATAAGIGIGLG